MLFASQSSTADDTIEVNRLQQENRQLTEQVIQLKAKLDSRNKAYMALTKKIRQFHEELVTQNQIEVQLLQSMANLVEENSVESVSEADSVLGDTTVSTSDEASMTSFNTFEPSEYKDLFSPVSLFDASTYRTIEKVALVDQSNQIQQYWNSGRSFTTREMHGDFYKISGYFVNKQWVKSLQALFIPVDKVIKS